MSTSLTYYKNAAIFDGRTLLQGYSLGVENEQTSCIIKDTDLPQDASIIELEEGILTPGYVELQANGGGGVLFNDDPSIDGLRTILNAHRQFGSVAVLPTFITDTKDKLMQALKAVSQGLEQGLPGLIGGHFEGPFINVDKKGTHQPDYIRIPNETDYALFAHKQLGNSLVTLAPENVPKTFIKHLINEGFKVNAGHTMASEEDMIRATSVGLSGVTHLYNAMPALQGRAPAVIGSAANLGLTCGIIVDGIHSHPTSLRLAYQLFGKDHLHLVTDSMHTIGAPEITAFDLTGQTVYVKGDRLVNENGSLAGAHITMEQSVKNAVKFMQASVTDALTMAVTTPANYIGRPDLAQITQRSIQDILYLDGTLSIKQLPH